MKWNEMGTFNVTEQSLVGQKNNILKRKWLSDLELEEIKRNIKYIGNGEVGLESDVDEGWFLGFGVKREDCVVPNVQEERSNAFVIKKNMQIKNEDMTNNKIKTCQSSINKTAEVPDKKEAQESFWEYLGRKKRASERCRMA